MPCHHRVHNPSLDLNGVWLMQSSCNRLKLLSFPLCLCEDLSLLHQIPVSSHHTINHCKGEHVQCSRIFPMQHPPALLLARLNLSPGRLLRAAWLCWEGTARTKQRLLWTPGPCMERGRWDPRVPQQPGGLMAPGKHINTGINAERLMGSVHITGMKGGKHQQLGKRRLAATTGTGNLVMAESRAWWNSPPQQENIPSLISR